MTADREFVEDASYVSKIGRLEFIRRYRENQLSLLDPEWFGRNLLYTRRLLLHNFLLNKPEYIEHVLVTNAANYSKGPIFRRLLGPIFGNGLLVSEGEFWRRQRRIAAPAFHLRRVAAMTESMAACTQARLAQWRGISGPLDICAEMMSLTLDIVTRTMFSTDIAPEVESVLRLMNTRMPPPTALDTPVLPPS